MSTVSTTSKTQTTNRGAAPAASRPHAVGNAPSPPKPVLKQAEEDSDDSDEEEEEEEEETKEKKFADMSAQERHQQVAEKMSARLENPIFRILSPQYREDAVKLGAINISKSGGHYYQFPGTMKTDNYLECEIKYGKAVKIATVEEHDETQRLTTLNKDMKKAEALEKRKSRPTKQQRWSSPHPRNGAFAQQRNSYTPRYNGPPPYFFATPYPPYSFQGFPSAPLAPMSYDSRRNMAPVGYYVSAPRHMMSNNWRSHF